MNKIVDLLNGFNYEWSMRIKKYTEGQLKDSVDSVVANRNLIAHGKANSLSILRVKGYFKDCNLVINAIESVVSGRPLVELK
jgi:hypothetical protein